MNTKSEKKTAEKTAKKPKLFTIIAVCTAAALALIFIIGQIHVTSGKNSIKTEIALADSAVQFLDVDMIVIRDEKILTSSGQNIVSAVKDSARVGVNDTVAYSFTDSTSAANIIRMHEISELLDYYTGLLAKSSTIASNTDSYDNRITTDLYSLSSMISSGKFTFLEDAKDELRDAVTSKQTATGVELDLTETINTLRSEYTALRNKTADYTEIKADGTGYYISGTDGYEGVLDYGDADKWSIADVERALASEPAPVSPTAIGKIVHGYYWYLACVTDTQKITDLKEGSRNTISFPDSSVEDITAQVYSISFDRESGKALVIFRCNKMNEDIASLRLESAQIILRTSDGYRIDNRAIRVNDKNETGVYVVSGMNMYFKKINIIYSNDDYCIVADPPAYDSEEKSVDLSGYVDLYDEYIVSGQDLADGKIIRR